MIRPAALLLTLCAAGCASAPERPEVAQVASLADDVRALERQKAVLQLQIQLMQHALMKHAERVKLCAENPLCPPPGE